VSRKQLSWEMTKQTTHYTGLVKQILCLGSFHLSHPGWLPRCQVFKFPLRNAVSIVRNAPKPYKLPNLQGVNKFRMNSGIRELIFTCLHAALKQHLLVKAASILHHSANAMPLTANTSNQTPRRAMFLPEFVSLMHAKCSTHLILPYWIGLTIQDKLVRL